MSVMKSGDASMSSEDHERRVIGKRLAKFDALDKALGRAIYVSDMVVPGMLHAKLVHSPHPHARIKSIDAEAAKALPGVRGVVTYADVPRIPYNPRGGVGSMEESAPLDKCVLDDTVRYVGDLVAGVAADSEDTAEEAASLIEVTYELLPPVLDPEDALGPDAPLVHPAISGRTWPRPTASLSSTRSETWRQASETRTMSSRARTPPAGSLTSVLSRPRPLPSGIASPVA